MWTYNAAFKQFVFESPAARIAARMMRANKVNIFYDQLLIKEPAELLQAGAIVGGDPDVGVEIEAIELSLTRAAGGNVTEVRLVAEATDTGAGAGPRATRP
jgi:hypothetical protein